MGKLHVGVIGVGYLGKFHADKYAAMDDVELVGVCDTNREAAEAVATKLGTRAFSDYHELLDHVAAVSIVVPTSYHTEVGLACLERGIHVMVEKPMTTTLDEADRLIAKADEKGAILQVGHLEQFNPAVVAMREHLTYPLFIESHRIHMFKSRGVDVDVVLDLMIHDIDIVLSIVNAPLKTIHTVGVPVVTPTTDIANARLIFENGCTANITVSRISKDNIRRIRVFQPRSYISVDYAKKEIMVITQGRDRDENGLPREKIIKSSFVEVDALEAELRDFVKNIQTGQTPRVSGREGRRALSVAQEIISQITANVEHFRSVLDMAR